jgi:hypothetical protein
LIPYCTVISEIWYILLQYITPPYTFME